jgi:antitoxin CptB
MNDINKEAQQRRLAWRCRRGMLELDIVLQRFVNEQFDTLSPNELQVFDEMLELPDNDFWALISSSKDNSKNVSANIVLTKLKAVSPKPN